MVNPGENIDRYVSRSYLDLSTHTELELVPDGVSIATKIMKSGMGEAIIDR